MQAILFDLRYALRTLFKKPGFTLVAVLSLALGIGLNTTIFSVVNAVLLKRMPVEDPERLVEVYSSPSEEMPYLTTSYLDYRDLKDGAGAFEGLYGVIAYSVSRRTREVGLRMALGARGSDVVRMILSSGMRLTLVGVGIGAVASAFLAKVLEAYLYGVSSIDPVAYLAAAFVLVAVAGAANLVPALRASRVSPMSALHYE